MNNNTKVKILLVGPVKSGKTTLANFLSDAADYGSERYRPTKGCRIVEFEVPNIDVNGSYSNVEVELWDISGDKSYSSTWPVMQRGANGVIFVYNPGEEDHPRYLDSLHTQFVSHQGLKDVQCVVFCHSKPDSDGYSTKLSNAFSGIKQKEIELNEENTGKIRQEFSSYLQQLLNYMSDMAERNEDAILQ
ncbi:UNVERIFIED_CONTAM: hypothetical protein RMT77_010585 [Armadillidium vulgare]